MFIDLTTPGVVEAEVWSLAMRGNIIAAASLREAVREVTLYTGRMQRPPEWSQEVRRGDKGRSRGRNPSTSASRNNIYVTSSTRALSWASRGARMMSKNASSNCLMEECPLLVGGHS